MFFTPSLELPSYETIKGMEDAKKYERYHFDRTDFFSAKNGGYYQKDVATFCN
jgi:hypothetical protein